MNKVAIIHDWLVTLRGGEKVLEVVLDLFPQAEIFTLVYNPKKMSDKINSKKIHTSIIQRFPFSKKLYKHYLFYHPAAIELFDLRSYDLVISLSHCVSKGVIVPQGIPHLTYMFTPMRYAYDMFYEYFDLKSFGLMKRILFGWIFNYLRTWDYISTQRVDKLITISDFVKTRIKRFYNKDSEIIYPPVNTEYFTPDPEYSKEDYYLIISALVPYKKIDLAIRAFNQTKKKLLIIGTGPELKRLKRIAGSNITLIGYQDDDKLRASLRKAKGLIFPGTEDFGITMVEALACGTPVIAFNGGGAKEIIKEGKTGVFFDDPSINGLNSAIERFENLTFEPGALRDESLRFSENKFKESFLNSIKTIKRNL
ncbi:glycosyltransferase [Candidatus Dependentiae bacterium]|nr:glycosyltransferase [Candidatus Dependentiae bacterium]